MLEDRKLREVEFHNKLRDISLRQDEQAYNYYWSNRKFYSITRKSTEYWQNLILKQQRNAKVLDYCCGDGDTSLWLAKEGFCDITGIDISDVSIDNCKRMANELSVSSHTQFYVMDAERLEFADDTFDIIICGGVLHHLDMKAAFPELARILKSTGKIICIEPLDYNPIIRWYRKRTPHLRTEWEAEHILDLADLKLARKSFGNLDVRFFHLAGLAAVPFRNRSYFYTILEILERVDNLLLRIPLIQLLAWQMIFCLSKPGKKQM